MMDDLHDGRADALVVYDLDRLARDPRDLEDLIDLSERHNVVCRAYTGSLRLDSDADVTMARVMVAMANKSSRDTARRVARAHLTLAEQGLPSGGRRRFGYEPGMTALRATEAEALRSAAQRILAGDTLAAVLRDFDARGIKPVAGGQWHRSTFKDTLCSPHVAGFRVHQGEPFIGKNGHPVRGAWEPLLDEDTWRAVREKLAGSTRDSSAPYRKYLLSGLVRCGLCASRMYGFTGRDGKARYGCFSKADGGCNKIRRLAEPIDDLIITLASAHIESIKDSAVAESDDSAERINALRSA